MFTPNRWGLKIMSFQHLTGHITDLLPEQEYICLSLCAVSMVVLSVGSETWWWSWAGRLGSDPGQSVVKKHDFNHFATDQLNKKKTMKNGLLTLHPDWRLLGGTLHPQLHCGCCTTGLCLRAGPPLAGWMDGCLQVGARPFTVWAT